MASIVGILSGVGKAAAVTGKVPIPGPEGQGSFGGANFGTPNPWDPESIEVGGYKIRVY